MARIRIPSLSGASGSHLVQVDQDGAACDCERYEFSKAPKGCRHTRIAIAALDLSARCLAAGHGPAEGTVCVACVAGLVAAMTRRVASGYVSKEAIAARREARKARPRLAHLKHPAGKTWCGRARRRGNSFYELSRVNCARCQAAYRCREIGGSDAEAAG